MTELERLKKLKLIEQNIQQFGFHFYFVIGGAIPRFVYTIGLRDSIEAELVIAGAIYYTAGEVKSIINSIYQQIKADKKLDSLYVVDEIGSFTLRLLHESWSNSLLLGALDFYKSRKIRAFQILPDENHCTIDIPDLGESWSVTAEPIWQWLHEEWPYNVSPKSTATTNIDALRGSRITEAVRWEDDEWEIFAGPGPDVSFEESRVVPLGTLLAADPTIIPVIDLEIGKGLWRENYEGSKWHPWGNITEEDDEVTKEKV